MNAQRFYTIDIAKAFAIILVVIGHFQNDNLPVGYDIMRDVIYMFHMPLFMFASGFLYQVSKRTESYGSFVLKKFKRLMIPYFTVSIIILCIKLLMHSILPVENPVTLKSFIEIFYYPSAGFFLWFIWALFLIMIIMPIFKTVASHICLLAIAGILHFLAPKLPEIFCLDKAAGMLIFFISGITVADFMKMKGITSFSSLWHILSTIIFCAIAGYILYGTYNELNNLSKSIIFLCANFSGIAMSISISHWWLKYGPHRLITFTFSIASASYIIYLLHTTFEGFAKGLLYKIHWFDLTPTLLSAWSGVIFVISCGLFVPWLLSLFISKNKLTSFLFGVKYNHGPYH